MSTQSNLVGLITKLLPSELAEMAIEAMRARKRGTPLAVAISPMGEVTLELPSEVIPADLVGVYALTPGVPGFGLEMQMAEDMREHVQQHGGRNGYLRRRSVGLSAGRKHKEAA